MALLHPNMSQVPPPPALITQASMSNTVVFSCCFSHILSFLTVFKDHFTVTKRTSLDVQAIFQVSLSFSYQEGEG